MKKEIVTKRIDYTWRSGKEILGSVPDQALVSDSIGTYVREKFRDTGQSKKNSGS